MCLNVVMTGHIIVLVVWIVSERGMNVGNSVPCQLVGVIVSGGGGKDDDRRIDDRLQLT